MNALPPPAPGPLGKAFAVVLGAVLLVAGFMFSVVLLAVVAVVGVVAFGYFWWKTRAWRKTLREQRMRQPPPMQSSDGAVFEGEAVVIEHTHVIEQQADKSRRD